jgi:DNA mismatch repair protein PMS2
VLENWNFDVNLAPDKRTILINDEDFLFSWVKEQVIALFAPFRQSELIYGTDSTELVSSFGFSSQPDLSSSVLDMDCFTYQLDPDDSVQDTRIVESSETKDSVVNSIQLLTPKNTSQESDKKLTQSNLKSLFGYTANTTANKAPKKDPDTFVQPKKKQKALSFLKTDSSKKLKRNSIFPLIQGDMHISVNLDMICARNAPVDQATPKNQFHAEISNSSQAEAELSRFVSKQDFKRMQILGQFNLGFIIVRLDSDLFVIDQHARYIFV